MGTECSAIYWPTLKRQTIMRFFCEMSCVQTKAGVQAEPSKLHQFFLTGGQYFICQRQLMHISSSTRCWSFQNDIQKKYFLPEKIKGMNFSLIIYFVF